MANFNPSMDVCRSTCKACRFEVRPLNEAVQTSDPFPKHQVTTQCFLRQTITLLAVTLLAVFVSSGCVCQKFVENQFNRFGAALTPPQLELAVSTHNFYEQHQRWPKDYAELRAFTGPDVASPIIKYERVDFTPRPDGGLEIIAVYPGMTNRITLTLSDRAQKPSTPL